MVHDVSFPHKKIAVALQWLYATKPWWSRYGSRFEIRPFTLPPAPDKSYGGLCFSTPRWVIYVDAGLAHTVSLEVLAGCLERELQRSVRNLHNRVSVASTDPEIKRLAHIASELEICSIMQSEVDHNSVLNVMNDHFVTQEFSLPLRQRWDVTGVPYIPEDMAFLPSELGFPEELSMEEYFRMLTEPQDDEPQDSDDSSSADDSDDEPEPDASEDSSTGDSADDGEPEVEDDSTDGGDQDSIDEDIPLDEDGGSDAGSADSDDSSESDSAGDATGGDQPDTSEGDEGSSSDTSEGDTGTGDASEGDSDMDSPSDHTDTPGEQGADKQDHNELDQSEPNPGEQQSADGEAEQVDTEGEHSSGGPGGGNYAEGQDQKDDSLQEKIRELLESPDRDWYTREHKEPEGVPEPDDMFSTTQDTAALEEFAHDVQEAAVSGSPGMSPGDTVLQWAGVVTPSGRSWESEFSSAVAGTIGEYKVFGGQDLSYSVPNPNQPRVGPILMGMYDTSPRVAVIMDRSGSMQSFLGTSMTAFADIVLSAVSDSGDPVDWISVDMMPTGYGQVSSVDDIDRIVHDVNKGWGGTDIGPVIQELTAGEFYWKGDLVDKPDITIVCTDCMFSWPWADSTEPDADGLILVASVTSRESVQDFLPAWLTEDKFIYVGED